MAAHGDAWQGIATLGNAWLVRLLGLESGSVWLVGQGMRTLQQWDDTSGCPRQPRDAGRDLVCLAPFGERWQ